MGWLKDYPRKYYEKYERFEIPITDERTMDWYDVYRLPHGVYAIAEPQQLQEVNSFLITGSRDALLVDTGMGILPIKPVIDYLIRYEYGTGETKLYTVNTHCHFDHIGSNVQFEPIYVSDTELSEKIAKRGLYYDDVDTEVTEDCFQFGSPEGFTPEEYRVLPYEIIPIEDGHIFDLGDRRIRAIATGGHCQDHMCFYDEDNNILFTGDLAYHGALFANFHNPIFGTSDLKRYADSMTRLMAEMDDDTKFYVSHNDLILGYNDFSEIAKSFCEVLERENNGDYPEDREVGQGFDFGEEGKKPHIYEFGKFSIYAGGED